MFDVIRSGQRGQADHGWLKSGHTFSFADYYNPLMMGFGPLRVINEDHIAGGGGFPTHPHKDMEIVTYVIKGALEHKDSMGTGSVIKAGDVQRMTAGTGVRHSEENHSATEGVHLFQIWLLPEAPGIAPGYEQKQFAPEEKRNRLKLVGSRDGREGSIVIQQDVALYASLLDAGASVAHAAKPGRKTWLQLASGELEAAGQTLGAGDALVAVGEEKIEIKATKDAEFILFDLA